MPGSRSAITVALLMVCAVGLYPLPAAAEQYTKRPFSFAIVPGLSTNGFDAARTRAHFSFNLFGGELGRLEGVELASLFNFEHDRALGYQGAGCLNIVLGDAGGVQTAGVGNIIGHNYYAAQFAGTFNFVRCTLNGFQAATVNIADRVHGMQVGVANIAASGLGMQMSVANLALGFGGVQLGVANIAGRFEGFQQGVVNIAGRAKGFQLGVVNIADNLDGEALGIVNIIGNGMHCLAFGYNELGFVEIGGKLGGRSLYSVYALGLEPWAGNQRWLAQLGLGGHVPLKSFFIDYDILAGSVRDMDDWDPGPQNVVGRLRVCGGWRFVPGLAICFGPTLNWTIAQYGLGLDLPTAGVPYIAIGSGTNAARIWPGFSLSLQVF